ncbi:MAG: PLDc N-terminal domain-containing protein [Candidatus Hodarchaeales archaeon]
MLLQDIDIMQVDFMNLMILIMLIFALVSVIVWLVALVDFLKTENMDEDRVVWAIVIVFAGPIGAILWYLIGRPKYRLK